MVDQMGEIETAVSVGDCALGLRAGALRRQSGDVLRMRATTTTKAPDVERDPRCANRDRDRTVRGRCLTPSMDRTAGCRIANSRSTVLVREPEVRYKSNIRSIERVFDTCRGSITMSTSTIAVDSRAPEVGRISAGLRGPVPGPSSLAGRQTEQPDRVRPGRRTGRGARPQARPDQVLPAPRALVAPGVRGCAPAAPARARIRARTRWRLTERGIAVVLVSLAMIATAALAVVSLTALRVTSGGYHPGTGQYAAQR